MEKANTITLIIYHVTKIKAGKIAALFTKTHLINMYLVK